MQRKCVIGNKPIMLETHQDNPMIHTSKPTILVGRTTQILGGEANKTKPKTIGLKTPTITTTPPINTPSKDHIKPHKTPPFNIYIKHKTANLNLYFPTQHPNHYLRIESPEFRLYLKNFARSLRITRHSRRK
ncbi:hypothetical protein AHAS_Ahas04G0119400 [Arachis hypogaea]